MRLNIVCQFQPLGCLHTISCDLKALKTKSLTWSSTALYKYLFKQVGPWYSVASLNLITHHVLVWFFCQPGSGQQMVDCFVKYLYRSSLLLLEFTEGRTPRRQLARQMEGEKALLPLLHFLYAERRTSRVSGCHGDLAFSDDSNPSACWLRVAGESERMRECDFIFGFGSGVCFSIVSSSSELV